MARRKATARQKAAQDRSGWFRVIGNMETGDRRARCVYLARLGENEVALGDVYARNPDDAIRKLDSGKSE